MVLRPPVATQRTCRRQTSDVLRRPLGFYSPQCAARRHASRQIKVSRREEQRNSGRCRAQAVQMGHRATQVLDGPISKDACTLQDVILSGETVDDKTGLRVAKALLILLAHRHKSSPQMPHGNIKPDTVYFPKGLQSGTKEVTAMFRLPLPEGQAPCGPDQAYLSQASATAQYIAPEHLAAAKAQALVDSEAPTQSKPLQAVNPFGTSSFGTSTMLFEADVHSNGHIDPVLTDPMAWGLEASRVIGFSGGAPVAAPTPASDCYQLGCVLMFAATGAQAQQHEGDLEARVIEVSDARGGPVGRVLASGSKFAVLIRGLLAVEEERRLTAAQALVLIDDKTWPPLPQGACIPFSFPKHLPEAFCFSNRRPLAQPWGSIDVTEPPKGVSSTVSVKGDSLVVSLPASPGIFQKWVAPGALVAGCGAVAWWLARTAVTSAQPMLLATAVPFGAAGAVLGNMVHQEGSQVDLLEISRESWGMTANVSRCSSASSGRDEDPHEGVRDLLDACQRHPEFLGNTDRLLGAKVVSLEVVDDDRTDTAILLCTACGHHIRFGNHLPRKEQQWVAAIINSHLVRRLRVPVTVENDLFPSTHAHIDVDDFD